MPLKEFHKSCAQIICDGCGFVSHYAEVEGFTNPYGFYIGRPSSNPEKAVKEEVIARAINAGFVEIGSTIRTKQEHKETKSRWLCTKCQETDPEWQALKKMIEPKKEVYFTVEHAKESPLAKAEQALEEASLQKVCGEVNPPRGGFF